jgi:hypothetical protein
MKEELILIFSALRERLRKEREAEKDIVDEWLRNKRAAKEKTTS